ncbi:probable inactive poly [ADP-ribose] polymerase SRO2 isoform X1 [Andrographis paniculata]|uniref:probable inactive poly [ADP-ribose] polymerase SRO2 isoform X1 n=1 Tax=Andrographis paniculata TaxID=175694 RepID=UPI0021E74E54|nr:probable inactive poly [ADP-ribose] polymerase SRO2 isoform X1 [Andrographis paniculata]
MYITRRRRGLHFLGSSSRSQSVSCFESFSSCTLGFRQAMDSVNSSPAVTDGAADAKWKGKVVAPARSSKPLTCELLIQNYSNFKRSAKPGRFMFYENGSWMDYPKELAEVMKLGFSEGKPMVEARVMGFNCLIDFFRMLEVELDSGNYRSISWIDVDGKCFFPKFFVNSSEDRLEDDVVNCNEACPKIQIDIKIRDNSVAGAALKSVDDVNISKRKRERNADNVKMEGSSSSSNAKRRHVDVVGTELDSPRWVKTRVLGAEEKQYEVITNLFLTGLQAVDPQAKVTSIHQCTRPGPMDKARREVFLKQMEIMERARGRSNVVFAWYGTSANGVENILLHGFGIPTEMPRHKGHGIGIHLSPIRIPGISAMLSDMDESGEKHIILCRVILGRCEKVEAGSQQLYPSSVEYDTGVDDLDRPKWYTVWHANMNTHILPEYVVSYKPVNPFGIVNGAVNAPHSAELVAKLLFRLKTTLPPPRFQELQTIWASFKNGRLTKDLFMKQLRSAVGDDVLRSAIQEIRG